MSFSKATALVAAAVLLFGTSLFSRDRDSPSWAWTPGGAAAANLSELATASLEAPHTRVSPGVEVSSAPTPSLAIPLQAPALSIAAEGHGAANRPARRMSSGAKADRPCAAPSCGHGGVAQRSARPARVAEAKPVPTHAEPIEFRLAVRGN
jgi:hypothetical protein